MRRLIPAAIALVVLVFSAAFMPSQSQLLLGVQKKVAAGGGVAGQLDPAQKSSNVNLTAGNLTATGNGSAGLNDNVRSVTSHSSGKFYFEGTMAVAAVNAGIGVVNGSFTIGANYVGETNNGIADFAKTGLVLINGTNPANVASANVGDVVCVAVDIGNAVIWWRVNGGDWNANPANDPSTNTGGISISALGAVALYAAFEIRDASNQWVVKLATGTFAFGVPGGFSAWN